MDASAHVKSGSVRPVRAIAPQRLGFLAETGRILAESLEYEGTLRTAARLAVPEIADWCIIDLLRADGTLARVATEHRDAERRQLIAALHDNPPKHGAVSGPPSVVLSGTTEYVPRMSDALLQQRESDPMRLSILKRLELNSSICAPLIARRRILGAITLCTTAGRDLLPHDVQLAEALAERAAIAIDNARLYDEARQAVAAREAVLAIVTHDLRAPLSAVLAGAFLLTSVEAANPVGERIKRRGETIQRSAEHMLRLVNDLTDLAQIDAGRLVIQKTLEDPAVVVREVIDALEPVVTRRGGTLQAQITSHLPAISLDRDRVRQVLANLVGNASKVGASAITVGAELRDSTHTFWVADNGPGIRQEDLPRMFERYWRGRGSHYNGSGLGLPISDGIVKAHGGHMWIESAEGLGSTFLFSIPT